MLLLSDRDIVALLPMDACMEAMADVLRTLATGGAVLPLRTVMRLPNGSNAFAVMPAYIGSPEAVGAKVITVFPGNDATPLDSHQGAVLLFDPAHGELRAILDASSITAIRTAAVSGVATRALARDDAHDLAILGAGVQAQTHLDAMMAARAIDRVRVWSRTTANAEAFVQRNAGRYSMSIEAVAGARAAVEGADIICTVTASRTPVLEGAWIAPGAHINAVGASLSTARELDSAAVARSSLFVDRRESALNEAGDFLIPKSEGAIGDDHIRGELGQVLTGAAPGRERPDEITLFKSLGLAIEDLAAAYHVYVQAVHHGAGVRVELGGLRHAE
ncbi:MAG: ornithine cyclodeaminase family protein [Gemmatimonadota bacterium]|nr:ornithine cyclodeaminase family protein [Gemmatimonadota bacterium]